MRIAALGSTVAAAVLALGLAACASTSNGEPTTGPSSPAANSPTAPASSAPVTTPTSFPSTSASAPSTSGGELTTAQAQAALLTAAEIGGGFQQTTADDSDTPLPCTPSDPPLTKQFPPDVNVQVDFAGLSGKALVSEQIEAYPDTATLAQVIAAGEKGLGCSTATVSGTKIQIQGPTDLTAQLQVPVDKAEAWTLTSTAINAGLIIVQLGQHLVVFSFGAAPGVDTSKLPDSQQIFIDGLQKVAAALK